MIILITGTPGAGKTLNSIKFVNEDDQFKDRPIFYFNIKELTLDWVKLGNGDCDLDSVFEWYNLPHGAVVVVDECQAVFPPRNIRSEPPKHISELNTHRHLGIDLVLITQHSRLIDSSVRPLVGMHIHYERKYGWTRVKRLTFEQCQENINSKAARELAQIKQVNFDKNYYGVYKSAEVHTHKKRIPIKLILILCLFLILPIYLFFAAGKVSERADSEAAAEQGAEGAISPDGNISKSKPQVEVVRGSTKTVEDIAQLPLDPAEYLKLYEPRVSGIAHTAPIYDGMVQPQEVPKTLCTSWTTRTGVDKCQCFTQQITKLNVPYAACKNIVDHRMWDPTFKNVEVTYNSSGNRVEG